MTTFVAQVDGRMIPIDHLLVWAGRNLSIGTHLVPSYAMIYSVLVSLRVNGVMNEPDIKTLFGDETIQQWLAFTVRLKDQFPDDANQRRVSAAALLAQLSSE